MKLKNLIFILLVLVRVDVEGEIVAGDTTREKNLASDVKGKRSEPKVIEKNDIIRGIEPEVVAAAETEAEEDLQRGLSEMLKANQTLNDILYQLYSEWTNEG